MTTVNRQQTRELVARTMVTLTQDVAQGLTVKNIVSVNCNTHGRGNECLECINIYTREQNLLYQQLILKSFDTHVSHSGVTILPL